MNTIASLSRPTSLAAYAPPATRPAAVVADTVSLSGASTGKKVVNSLVYGVAGATVGLVAGGLLTTAVVSSLASPDEGLGILYVGAMGAVVGAAVGGVTGAVVGWRRA